MKTQKRLLSALLAVCMLLSILPSYARAADDEIPSPSQVYEVMINLKNDNPKFAEGKTWNDQTNEYRNWKGGLIDGKVIWATGCAAFAMEVSDIAFGNLPARKFSVGQFKFEDVKNGDILRVNNDTHTVIVLQTSEDGLVLAEGNFNGKVHWGRTMSVAEFNRDVTTYVTRYPEGYVSPDDETADEEIDGGAFGGGLTWKLTNAGTLTISGSGPIPDYDGPSTGQPWDSHADKIRKIVIEDGVTKIGKAAFYDSQALTLRLAGSVAEIGSSAFYGSMILSATIPGSVKSIGADAFRSCPNLSLVTANEGVEAIGERAFQGCIKMTSLDLPSTIKSLGAGAFYDCETLAFVTFAPGNKNTVEIGDDLFARCWVLRPFTLPESINKISKGMFQNCFMLFTGIEIPQGVKVIGESAFASCSNMSVVIIPDSVTDIETAAFQQTSLTDIYFKGTKAQWNGIWKSNSAGLSSDINIHYSYEDSDGNDSLAKPDKPHTHEWSASVKTEPSCGDGLMVYLCDCGYTMSEVIPSIGGEHSFGEYVTDEYGGHTATCAVCGEVKTIPAGTDPAGHEHQWDEGEETKAPTETETGLIKYTCTVCWETRTETIPAASTGTPTETPGPTTEPSASPDPTSSPTETPAPSITPDPTTEPSASPDPTGTPTETPGPSATPDHTSTPSVTPNLPGPGVPAVKPVPTPTPTGTASPAPAPDNSPTPSPDTDTASTVTLPDGGKSTTIKSVDGGIKIIAENAQGENTANISIPSDPGPAKPFLDVQGRDWYKEDVDAMTSLGLFAGTGDANFSPNTAMTRGMFAAVLHRLSGGVGYGVGSGAFDDVVPGAWYTDAVEWAQAAGVVSGVGANSFEPGGDVTREQLVAMLYRYAKLIGKDSGNSEDISSFPDSGKVSSYAKDAMSWAVAEGFVQGRGRDLAPQGNATRAEAAAILSRFVRYLTR